MEFFKRFAHGAGKHAAVLGIKSRAAMDTSKIKQKLTQILTEEERLMMTMGRKVYELYQGGGELDDSLVYFCQTADKCKTQREELQEQLNLIQKRAEKEIERANEQERQHNEKRQRVSHSAPPKPIQQTGEMTVIEADMVPPTLQAEIVNAEGYQEPPQHEETEFADEAVCAHEAVGADEAEFADDADFTQDTDFAQDTDLADDENVTDYSEPIEVEYWHEEEAEEEPSGED